VTTTRDREREAAPQAHVSDALRFAFGTLSVLRIRVTRWDRPTAGLAMLYAPLVGLVLGAAASLAALLVLRGGTLLAGVAATAALAALTRGLHLDGLADTADGLGSGRPAEDALRIMKASDIGPFGVLTLVLVVLGQIAALSRAYADGPAFGVLTTLAAAVLGRAALAWGCARGVPSARPEGLGAAVAGTVPLRWAAGQAALLGAALAAAGWWTGGLRWFLALACATGLALLAARLLLRRCVIRFGGVTGDVLGALVETAQTAALIAAAVLGTR